MQDFYKLAYDSVAACDIFNLVGIYTHCISVDLPQSSIPLLQIVNKPKNYKPLFEFVHKHFSWIAALC